MITRPGDLMRRLSGWTSIWVTLVVWVAVVGAVGAVIFFATRNSGPTPQELYANPEAVPLRGTLSCPPTGTATPVSGAPASAAAAIAVDADDQGWLALSSDGVLTAGPLTSRAGTARVLARLPGAATSLDISTAGDTVAVGGPSSVWVLDRTSGRVLGGQTAPAGADLIDVQMGSTWLYASDPAHGTVYRATWSYGALQPLEVVPLADKLTDVGAILLVPTEETLLVGADGGVQRIDVRSRTQQRSQAVELQGQPVTVLDLGQFGNDVWVTTPQGLRVMQLNGGSFTGRLSGVLATAGGSTPGAVARWADTLYLAGVAGPHGGRSPGPVSTMAAPTCTVTGS